MRALSISRPWPFALLHLGKGVENRMRSDGKMPYMVKHRGPLLLHAAQSWDSSAMPWIAANIGKAEAERVARAEHRAGVIFTRCDVKAHVDPEGVIIITDPLLAGAGPLWNGFPPDMRWHMRGQFGMVLADIAPTPKIECKGMLGLWTPSPPGLAGGWVAAVKSTVRAS